MAAVLFPKPEVVSSQPWIEISSKFGRQIDFHLLKRMQSLALNKEAALGPMSAIWKNWYDVITPPAIVWLRRNLEGWRKITCLWLQIGQNRNKR